MSTCVTINNLGVSGCAFGMKPAKRLIFVPELNSTGTKNEFANVAAVTKSALQAKFDDSEVLDRFYPLPIIQNPDNKRDETVFQTFNNGERVQVRPGTRKFMAVIPLEHPQLKARLDTWKSKNFGVYIIDEDSNFVYQTDVSTKLKVQPLMVYGKSLDIQFIHSTSSETPMLQLTFDFSTDVKDELLRIIPSASLDFNGLTDADVYALLDVTTVFNVTSTTAGTLTCTTTDYGDAVSDLLTGDLALYNVTDSAVVANATFAETSEGVYAVTFAAQTSADVIRATFTKSRYSFTAVTDTVP